MSITGIYGLPGRGKSLFMLQYGLELANKYKLRLVTNFELNPDALAFYCKINNLKWLFDNIPKGVIYYVSANKNFAQFVQISNSVILLDEMGIYAPSSQSWTLPAEAHNAIANNRKRMQHIVYCAQYPSQVNSSLHQVCSQILYAEGACVYDEKLGNDKLVFKDVHLFNPPEFKVWFDDPKIRKNPVKVWVLAMKHWKGVLNCFDAATFDIYDSFGLLEEQDFNLSENDEFGYQPIVIDGLYNEATLDKFASAGISYQELEQILDNHYKVERNKRKRIYEANAYAPFLAFKLRGQKMPFLPPHPLQNRLKFLWQLLPVTTYSGLKKLDLLITKEFFAWNRLSKSSKKSYRIFFRLFLGAIFWIVAILFMSILQIRHPLIAFAIIFLSFYLPINIIK